MSRLIARSLWLRSTSDRNEGEMPACSAAALIERPRRVRSSRNLGPRGGSGASVGIVLEARGGRATIYPRALLLRRTRARARGTVAWDLRARDGGDVCGDGGDL